MKLGFIGLGRMGGNMVQRLLRARHEVVVYDLDSSAVKAVVSRGAKEAKSIDDLVASLVPTRIIWVMLPAGAPTFETLKRLSEKVEKGDIRGVLTGLEARTGRRVEYQDDEARKAGKG